MANIQLDADHTEYSGGSLHVEGMGNESIVATGIFYYDIENCSPSELRFRTAIRPPVYEQFDEVGVRKMFGLTDGGPLHQDLGAVATVGGRCIAFPNTYQHQVAPFRLVDAQKPGHRKMLVFFLVNPMQRVASTAIVPPQQAAWLASLIDMVAMDEQGEGEGARRREGETPPLRETEQHGREGSDELRRKLVEIVQQRLGPDAVSTLKALRASGTGVMTMTEAKAYRAELIQERSMFAVSQARIFDEPFSLCEH